MKILNQLPPEIKKGQMVAFDFETFGQEESKLHRPVGTFACISVAVEGDPNVYQLYDHHDLRKLYPVIRKGTWVAHNALYDLRQFRRFVSINPTFVWDTMLVDQSMQGGLYLTFSLGDLSRRWLGQAMDKEVRKDFSTMTEMTKAMKDYAARDAQDTLKIALKQRERYSDDLAFRAYTDADEPMLWPVMDMPGFRVDVDGWKTMTAEFLEKSSALEKELGINVMSPAQVKKAAAENGLHLKDTSAETLQEFQDRPFIQKIIETRMYRKAVSTYGEKWLNAVEGDGKVYADYHITGASVTGRMSCSNPNMQNIPQRKLPIYRTRFIASPDHVIYVVDVNQQEPCITAFHTQDAKLLKATKAHEDLHLAVARTIYHDQTLTKERDGDKRAIGKAINLGMTYGLTAYGLAARTGMSEEESEKVIKQYFANFGGVFSWIQNQRQIGWKKGYVTTALGRRSYLNLYDRKWENNAINSPIQGGGADFTKIWSRKVWEKCQKQGVPYSVVAWVHDEIVLDVHKECQKETSRILQESFDETALKLYPGVTMAFESESGKSWGAKAISTERAVEGEEE